MKRPPEVYSDLEVKALLNACSRRAPTGIRNRALIALLYRGGLRISEALALFPKDVDQVSSTVRVLHGKGDHARTIGLDPGAFALLQLWLIEREKLFGNELPLFCTLGGERIQPRYIRALMPRIGRKAGIQKRVHAHGFRHTHAAQLAAERTPLNVIQVQLGHSNVATTSRYLQHLAPQEVIDTMRKRKWNAFVSNVPQKI